MYPQPRGPHCEEEGGVRPSYLQTYHSLKLGASPSLCPDVFCTASGGVFVGSSVLAETSTGGVDDSYPELAAGDDSDP